MKKIILKYGLIAGAIVVGYSVVVFLLFGDLSKMTPLKFQVLEALGFLRYIILILTVWLAMRTFKRDPLQKITYWSLVKLGVMVAMVVGLCVGAMEFFYIAANPDFYESFGKIYMANLKSEGATETAIAEAMADMENYKWMQSPVMTGLFYFFETAVLGSVAALATARFLKPKKGVGSRDNS